MYIWASRCSQLNHHWVGNRLAQSLARLERVSEGRVAHPGSEWSKDFGELWMFIAQEVNDLAGSVENDMSPRALFDEPPLCHCSDATKQWLMTFVHELWVRRIDLGTKIRELTDAAEYCEHGLAILLRSDANTCTEVDRGHLGSARVAVGRLSAALSAMPRTPLL
jgi:hypothetical protein